MHAFLHELIAEANISTICTMADREVDEGLMRTDSARRSRESVIQDWVARVLGGSGLARRG